MRYLKLLNVRLFLANVTDRRIYLPPEVMKLMDALYNERLV